MKPPKELKSWEELGPAPIDKLLQPLGEFLHVEALGGILLIAATVAALVWANSPWAASYDHVWNAPATIGLGPWTLSKPLLLWIDEGFMAVFFFTVGLEIKREVLVGELATGRQAVLPIAAAAGGMAAPALIYFAFNAGTPGQHGWGIPMATDIAFALGVLSLLRGRAPLSLKVFLTALAIADDLGAVVIIALFYTSHLYLPALAAAGVIWAVMIAANLVGVRAPLVYFITGVALWFAMLLSGVHATVGGVLGAMTIPATRRLDCTGFLDTSRLLLTRMEDSFRATGCGMLTVPEQFEIVQQLKKVRRRIEPPLQRLEHAHHPWVAYFIMPVFALANAGVTLHGDLLGVLAHPVALGVILGLVAGKQAGVMGVAWLFLKLGWAKPLAGATWRQVYGAACLCGIGFTMSIFISGLALTDPALLEAAKVGIFAASIVSGILGWLILATARPAS